MMLKSIIELKEGMMQLVKSCCQMRFQRMCPLTETDWSAMPQLRAAWHSWILRKEVSSYRL